MENNSAAETISTLRVSLAEVMDNLKLVSSYLGGKREEQLPGYARVAALDSDAALVALLMEDAALIVAGHFPGRLIRWRYTRSALEFTIAGEVDTDGLHSSLVRVMSLEVLRRWLRIVGSDYADTVSESAAEAADSLKIYFPDDSGTGDDTADGSSGSSGSGTAAGTDDYVWRHDQYIASRRPLPPF